MPAAESFWDESKVARLTALHDDGWTASAMAYELGATRNSVLGKLFRLGLCQSTMSGRKTGPRPVDNSAPKPPKAFVFRELAKGYRHKHKPHAPHVPAPAPARTRGGVAILDLRQEHCRYPLWPMTERNGLYCGRDVVEGESWCPGHYALVYRPREIARAA